MSLGHSKDKAIRGTCGRGQPVTLVYLVTHIGWSQPVCRDIEEVKKSEVKKNHTVMYYYIICNDLYNVPRLLNM